MLPFWLCYFCVYWTLCVALCWCVLQPPECETLLSCLHSMHLSLRHVCARFTRRVALLTWLSSSLLRLLSCVFVLLACGLTHSETNTDTLPWKPLSPHKSKLIMLITFTWLIDWLIGCNQWCLCREGTCFCSACNTAVLNQTKLVYSWDDDPNPGPLELGYQLEMMGLISMRLRHFHEGGEDCSSPQDPLKHS